MFELDNNKKGLGQPIVGGEMENKKISLSHHYHH